MNCIRCHQDLPASEFDPHRTKKRLKAACHACCKIISKEARANSRREFLKRGGDPNKPGRGLHYADRSRWLKALGFSTYREYLDSDIWKQIRDEVFRIKGRACYLCGAPANQVHHNRYHWDDLTGKRLTHVFPICGGCHREIEFNGKEKRSVSHAKMAFNRKRKAAL